MCVVLPVSGALHMALCLGLIALPWFPYVAVFWTLVLQKCHRHCQIIGGVHYDQLFQANMIFQLDWFLCFVAHCFFSSFHFLLFFDPRGFIFHLKCYLICMPGCWRCSFSICRRKKSVRALFRSKAAKGSLLFQARGPQRMGFWVDVLNRHHELLSFKTYLFFSLQKPP